MSKKKPTLPPEIEEKMGHFVRQICDPNSDEAKKLARVIKDVKGCQQSTDAKTKSSPPSHESSLPSEPPYPKVVGYDDRKIH